MPFAWQTVREFQDIKYERFEGIAKITINRPEVRNAFRPETIFELQAAFADVRDDPSIGVVLLTGEGPDAFCSGGDQRIRGDGGYVDPTGVPRLNVLDLHRQIRLLPKPVIAVVAGYAIGGGHVLHVVCDLTIAADNSRTPPCSGRAKSSKKVRQLFASSKPHSMLPPKGSPDCNNSQVTQRCCI